MTGGEFLSWRLKSTDGVEMTVRTNVVGWNLLELKAFLEALGVDCRDVVRIDLDELVGRELMVIVNGGVFRYGRLG